MSLEKKDSESYDMGSFKDSEQNFTKARSNRNYKTICLGLAPLCSNNYEDYNVEIHIYSSFMRINRVQPKTLPIGKMHITKDRCLMADRSFFYDLEVNI